MSEKVQRYDVKQGFAMLLLVLFFFPIMFFDMVAGLFRIDDEEGW